METLVNKKSTAETYETILRKFISKDDHRQWMSKPFLVGDMAVSTNGHSLVSVPKFNDVYDRSKKTEGVYPITHNCDKPIPLSELKDVLSKAPLTDCFDETKQKCDACYGSGSVEYEFYHKSKTYEIDSECPVCEGDGIILKKIPIPNGKKEIDYDKFVEIGECIFNIERIDELVFVAEQLGSDEVRLVKQSGKLSLNLFRINEVEVLAMPEMQMKENKPDVFAIIEM